MGKWVADAVLDGALQVISGADRMVVTAGQPSDYGSAWSGRLADVGMSASDFTTGGGSLSGRRVEVAAKSGVSVVAEGTADHVALLSSARGELLYVTTCPVQALSEGGTVNFDSWTVEIGAPA